MSHDLPKPPEIAEIPELALLSVLDFVLDASVRALTAAHPELEAESLPPGANTAVRCAERFQAHAYKLSLLLESYRHYAALKEGGSSPAGIKPW